MAITTTNTIVITATGNTAAAAQGFQNLTTNIKQTTKSVEDGSRAMSGMTSSLKGLFEIFSLWSGYRITKSQFSGIIEVSAEFQKLDHALQRFAGNEGMAQMMGWIEQLGRSSYGISNVEKAVVQLNAVGLKPTQAQMEGLIGYLLTVGKTGEHELNRLTGKMSELAQLGNVGMDDALKELSREFPQVMDAIMQKLKISPADLFLRDFKNRAVDFGTVMQALLEYVEKNFRNGITNTSAFWDVMRLRANAAFESIRRDIGRAGIFEELSKWFDGLLKQFDRLQQEGKIVEWAGQVSDAMTKFFNDLGLGGTSVEDIGGKIVKLTQDLAGLAPTIRGAASAIGDLLLMLGKTLSWFNQLPDNAKNGIGLGIVGKYLFGNYGMFAGLIMGARGLISDAMKDKNPPPETPESERTFNLMTGKMVDGSDYNVTARSFVHFGNRLGSPELLYPKVGGDVGVANSAEEAAQKTREYYENVANGQEAVIREGLKKIEEKKQAAVNQAAAEVSGGYATENNLLPGELAAMNNFISSMSKGKGHFGKNERQEATAGLEGYAKEFAAAWNDRYEWEQDFNNIFVNAEKYAQILWGGGRYEQSIKIMDDVTKLWSDYDTKFGSRVDKMKGLWDKKDMEKYQKSLVDVRDIDQNVAEMIRRFNSDVVRAQEIQMARDAEGMKGWSDSVEAEVKMIEANLQRTLGEIDKWVPDLERMQKEISDKLTKNGKVPTPDALQYFDWLTKYIAGKNQLAEEAKKDVTESAKIEIARTRAIGEGREELKVFQLQEAYAQLAGTTRDLARAKSEVIQKQEELDWLDTTGKNAQNMRDMTVQLREYERWLQVMKANGNALDGFRYGMHDIARQMPTNWDLGVQGAMQFKNALDGVADAAAKAATGTKVSVGDMAKSVVQDLIRMTIQATITNRIFSFLGNIFGLSGPAPGAGGVNPNVMPLDPRKVHAGGFIENAPRYHFGGLASDEIPAILQKGEYVVPKGQVPNLGTTIAMPISVTVPAPQTNGGSPDTGAAETYGKLIGQMVAVEVDKRLQQHLRPMGLLNKGVNS